MRKYLLPKEGNFYKANLHMHTTISDGHMTPEEVKEEYGKRGYSIVAFTDHEVMVPHNDLTDENFLSLTSTEIIVDNRKDCDFTFRKTYHLNIYSNSKEKDFFKVFSKNEMWLKHSYEYISKEQENYEYKRCYTVETINDIIKVSNDEGCLVSLNHPVWSLQNYADYIGLKGLWAVEWFNNGCFRGGFVDTINPIDDLLRVGENVFPTATDDSHNLDDCFGGFVMVKAGKLEYDGVFEALKKGDFYSSTKPEIYELYIEDGIVNIKTSNVKKIVLSSERRYTQTIVAKDDEYLTEGKIDINEYLNTCNSEINKNQYIRITLVDENGKLAYTRAYHLNELI